MDRGTALFLLCYPKDGIEDTLNGMSIAPKIKGAQFNEIETAMEQLQEL